MKLCPRCGDARDAHCTECQGCLEVPGPSGLVCAQGCEGPEENG
jgi:hypothetical protein